ncbi:BofC C-terminal domain-containing protein [Aquibacillus rhizosphaerae]|uniref:BofC C-terminal domain-containing protein n=1 Tax=Aquibacillus rhizosphaerae TaxID=3051431 RepID=A0ABT7LAR3_9BACI|nr:BofC C-terminal domain-containing protein [Aquibacillus sp. LR5S19]MDL4841641.1 BofC C-terminal domain-containing protein [Aquibacillus sp. LR5S19]
MKKHILFLVLSISVVVIGLGVSTYVQADNQLIRVDADDKNGESSQQDQLVLEVTLQKQYLDGKIVEETHEEKITAMEDFWSYYHGWQVMNQEQGKIVFKKQIDDISPYLKENGYFGLSNDILTIFEGKPDHEQVIQSFYQIDTSELESYQAKELQDGIKIDSKEVYDYVLEAFREMTPSRSVSS